MSEKYHWLPYTKGDPVLTTKKQGFEPGYRVTFLTFHTPSNSGQRRQIPACSEADPIAIALTAYAGEYDQKQGLAAGFQRHIPKLVEADILVQAIATPLGENR